ncbi:MAG: tyrosine--tRNA ligase [Anaerolineae bacterium]|nr:tyrosine--tRNA ligase [Anaerolineae bacterium]
MMNPMTIDEQVDLLMQGTEYGDDQTRVNMAGELRQRLLESEREGRPLRVYCGYDPRTADLHIGHTITMRKLCQFQKLGHEVTFLVGSYTSLVGDPSDHDKTRPVLTETEVEANARTYAAQAFRILDPEKTQVRHNGEWLSKLRLVDLIRLAQNFTVQQFLNRENFAKRLAQNEPIFLHETFYALMQGYDAVAQQAEVQVGGTDQLFNILVAGRKLQAAMGQKPQVAIVMGLLPGTDGVVKMSKSLGNHIPISAPPEDMYGKVMSIPDFAMPVYFRLATRYTPAQVATVETALADNSRHPRDVKMELAREIVSIFYGEQAATEAERHFIRVFQQQQLPEAMPEFQLAQSTNLVDLMAQAGLAPSKSEARRLIQQGGVRVDGRRVEDIAQMVEPGDGSVIQVGKRKFLRVTSG